MIQDPESRLWYSVPEGFVETPHPDPLWRIWSHPDLEGEICCLIQRLEGGWSFDIHSEEGLVKIGKVAGSQFQSLHPTFQLHREKRAIRVGHGYLLSCSGEGVVEGVPSRAKMFFLILSGAFVVFSVNERQSGNSLSELWIRAEQMISSFREEQREIQGLEASSVGLIFLSHNSKDKPAVERLAAKLEGAGYKVWLDKYELDAGDLFALKLDKALGEAQVMVLVLGEHGLGPWQAAEYAHGVARALNKTLTFIPFALSKNADWPPLASTFQGILPPAGVEELLEALEE